MVHGPGPIRMILLIPMYGKYTFGDRLASKYNGRICGFAAWSASGLFALKGQYVAASFHWMG